VNTVYALYKGAIGVFEYFTNIVIKEYGILQLALFQTCI